MTTDAWRQLGVPLETAVTAEQALKEGLLTNWDVRKVPLYAALPEDANGVSRSVEVLERVAVVRDSPHTGAVEHIGIVSPSYQIIPNEDQADLLNAMAGESGASFVTAGEMEGGRKVFVTLQLPGHINVGGVDAVECYISTVKSHDGTFPFNVLVTPVRVATGAVLGAYRIGVRHTSGAGAALDRLARHWLDDTFGYLENFQRQAEELVGARLTQARFESVLERQFGRDDDASAAATTRADKKIAQLAALFTATQDDGGIRDTAWAGFSAMTEWYDFHSPVRGDTSRAQKAVLDTKFKDQALALMRKVA